MRKKLQILVGVALLLLIVMVGLFKSMKLVWKADRPYRPVTLNQEVTRAIDKALDDIDSPEDAVKLALRITADRLVFTERNDLPNGEANCVGYAQYYATVCNRLLQAKGGTSREYTVTPVVGHVALWGVNLCHVASGLAPTKYKSFVKDHDFVRITHGASTVYVDPSAYDLLCTDLRTKK